MQVLQLQQVGFSCVGTEIWHCDVAGSSKSEKSAAVIANGTLAATGLRLMNRYCSAWIRVYYRFTMAQTFVTGVIHRADTERESYAAGERNTLRQRPEQLCER